MIFFTTATLPSQEASHSKAKLEGTCVQTDCIKSLLHPVPHPEHAGGHSGQEKLPVLDPVGLPDTDPQNVGGQPHRHSDHRKAEEEHNPTIPNSFM